MKRAVSISLGSSSQDKGVQVAFNGVPIIVERIGKGRTLTDLELNQLIEDLNLHPTTPPIFNSPGSFFMFRFL